MEWMQVGIETTKEGIDPICGMLYTMDITGTEIEDADDFTSFLEENTQYWDYVDEDLMQRAHAPTVVKVYLKDNDHGRQTLEAVKARLAELKASEDGEVLGSLNITINNMLEQDWGENWKQFYKPLKLGKKMLIRPEWEQVDDAEGRTVFTINPGMSFGTGTHESTQLCLESLENYLNDGDSVLDLGCGSGILSVMAMLLGAKDAYAVDIDPNAVKIAEENAAKNNVDASVYKTAAGNVLTDDALISEICVKSYDMVLANIVADVIIGLSDFAYKVLKDGGIMITSGIIHARLDEVEAKLKDSGFTVLEIHKKGEWASIVLKK
ncbi:MAG: 50S ribosomal protein L11 methyltransferase [Clostridia bacterium]|nr:50S ribosomal protein L11 methyltransferase [Clostridia bacterium]